MDERPAIGYYVKTPAVSLRERIVVKCVAIVVALVVHFFAFYAVGLYIDAMRASFDVDIAWSTEPLTGFGKACLRHPPSMPTTILSTKI